MPNNRTSSRLLNSIVSKQDKLYSYSLIVSLIIIYIQIVLAKNSPYDVNYGLIIDSLVLSIIVSIGIVLLYIFYRNLVLTNKTITIIYFVFGSPISIFGVIYLYYLLVGNFFSL
jgi:hypothetical protein